MVDFAKLAGLDDSCIEQSPGDCPVHRDLLEPLEQLRQRAAAAGFELALASGWRSFEKQLAIWNAKARGDRPLLDDHGRELDAGALTDDQKLWSILRWSALPGGSRHHWGSDIDVYDAGPCHGGYKLRLTYAETCSGGAFAAFHEWLGRDLHAHPQFFPPYTRWDGGVAPEPWHLSYRPLAELFVRKMAPQPLKALIEQTEIALKPEILQNFDEIYDRFVAPL